MDARYILYTVYPSIMNSITSLSKMKSKSQNQRRSQKFHKKMNNFLRFLTYPLYRNSNKILRCAIEY